MGLFYFMERDKRNDLIHPKELMKFKTPNTYDTNFSEVPKKPGIYFFTTPFYDDNILFGYEYERILYIGGSKNLYNRYNSHEKSRFLKEICRTSFYFFETELYKEKEIELIKYVNPICNIQHNIYGRLNYAFIKNDIKRFSSKL